MKYITNILFLAFSLVGHAQTAFYSNDLSKDEIWNLVDDRDKWKKQSKVLEDELKKARAANDVAAITRANRKLYSLRTQLEGVKQLAAAEKSRLEGQLSLLRKDAAKNQKAIADLQQKVAELTETIGEQQKFIVNLQDEIQALRGKVSEQELEIQDRLLELEYARLLVSRNGSDVAITTNKRRKIRSGAHINQSQLRLKMLNRSKRLFVQTSLYRLSSEVRQSKEFYPEAQFYLYEVATGTQIMDKKFVLSQSETAKPKRKDELPESAKQGIVFWGLAEVAIPRKLTKGNYYYLIVIDKNVTVMDFFDLK